MSPKRRRHRRMTADGTQVERSLREWLAPSHGGVLQRWATRQLQLTDRDSNGAPGAAFSSTVLFIMVAFLSLGLAATSPSPTAHLAPSLPVACTLLLVGLAAWPMLFLLFDTDAPIIRAASAATDVFGDSFHPFLPFLLNRPVTWFSLEPWALRLMPLVFLGLETVLLMLAARRDGGAFAGALAGTWFACEVRRRHGLWDLSDWDFAGTFLTAMLVALQRPATTGWRYPFVLALCSHRLRSITSKPRVEDEGDLRQRVRNPPNPGRCTSVSR